ncbi:MAG: class I SAM-dependent methyltransferase [Rhizobiaceae bacterium]|jgi:predicted TPR repeat methyltransferase|nr:class I SAM-dependent methyltransferase [Rhizobiaceae bacterium]
MSQRDTSAHLGGVYGAENTEEVAALYDGWAETYDADMAKAGYRHPALALALFARHMPRGAAPVLDAGCGTGLVGEWLALTGYTDVHALDISEGMLAVARRKHVYSGFTCAALGDPLPFADRHFAGVISAGVFTTGHVGAEGLDELIRITQAGGVMVLTVKRALWDGGFAARIDALCRDGRLTALDETPHYVSMPGEAGTTPSFALALRVD